MATSQTPLHLFLLLSALTTPGSHEHHESTSGGPYLSMAAFPFKFLLWQKQSDPPNPRRWRRKRGKNSQTICDFFGGKVSRRRRGAIPENPKRGQKGGNRWDTAVGRTNCEHSPFGFISAGFFYLDKNIINNVNIIIPRNIRFNNMKSLSSRHFSHRESGIGKSPPTTENLTSLFQYL